jgi:hypothetical protein
MVRALMEAPKELVRMGECARTLARAGAAQRAAQILEEIN